MPRLTIAELLHLTSSPVAISFVDAAPAGVTYVEAIEPAGCGHWRRAAEGEVFYPVADDHKRCPVVAGAGPAMGRPTCAVIPEAINADLTSASFGCVGNRVYTGAADTDAYFAIPGDRVGAVERSLATIVRANTELEKFHRARAEATI